MSFFQGKTDVATTLANWQILRFFLTGTLHDLSFDGTFLMQGKAAASADFIKDKAK